MFWAIARGKMQKSRGTLVVSTCSTAREVSVLVVSICSTAREVSVLVVSTYSTARGVSVLVVSIYSTARGVSVLVVSICSTARGVSVLVVSTCSTASGIRYWWFRLAQPPVGFVTGGFDLLNRQWEGEKLLPVAEFVEATGKSVLLKREAQTDAGVGICRFERR